MSHCHVTYSSLFFRITCQFNFSSWILVVLSSSVFVGKRNSNPTISCRAPPKKIPPIARFPFASPSPDPGGWNSIWPCAFWLQFCQSMVSVGDENGSEGWHVTSGEFCKLSFVCWISQAFCLPRYWPAPILPSSVVAHAALHFVAVVEGGRDSFAKGSFCWAYMVN